ncbi:MAG: SpoIIE family protein phosphatase, partial [Desulfobacterales bacterium]
LGADMVNNLALSFSVVSAFKKKSGDFFDYSRFWKDSLFSAIACKHMTGIQSPDMAEDAYFLGLLHNIGVLTLHTCNPHKYGLVLAEKKTKQLPLRIVEENVFGFTHAALGQRLSSHWKLPESFSVPIAFHHEPDILRENTAPQIVLLTHILHLTSQLIDFVHSTEKAVCLKRFEGCLQANGLKECVNLEALLAECQDCAQSIFPTFDLQVESDQNYLDMLDIARRGLQGSLRLRKEMTLAKEVQQNLLPREAPRVSGLDIYGVSLYCEETGGDYYDYFRFGSKENEVLGIAVGDVVGHGLAAALMMTTVRAFMRSIMVQTHELPEVTAHVNRLLCMDTEDTSSFMTLFCLLLDKSSRSIRWVRAGHDPALVYDPRKDVFHELQGKGVALGIDASHTFQENRLEGLAPGAVLLLGTDGIWETQNKKGEKFGKDRLKTIVQQHSGSSSQAMAQAVITAVECFREDSKQQDDITLVIVKLNPV